jgi:hypothetical protein
LPAAGLADAEADALAAGAEALAVAVADAVIVAVAEAVEVDAGIADEVSDGIADDVLGIAVSLDDVEGVAGGLGLSPPQAAAMIEAAARATNGMINGRELVRRAAFFMRASLYASAARCEHVAHFNE